MSFFILVTEKQEEVIRQLNGSLPSFILASNKIKIEKGGVMKGKKPTKKPTKNGK